MFTSTNFLLAMEIHQERQREILNQIQLHNLLTDHQPKRRETLQRLIGLLRPVAMTKVFSRNVEPAVVRGA